MRSLWGSWGLAARFVGMTLVLLLLVQLAGFGVVVSSIERNARGQIGRELEIGERVWRRLLDQNAERLRQGSALLAADFGFRSAVNSGDLETIRSVLDNHGQRIGATVTALFDTELKLRAVSETLVVPGLEAALQQLVIPMSAKPQGGQIALVGRTPYQFVLVPMKAPVVIGWVLMGFPIGQELLDDMHALLPIHVLLIAQARGEAARVVVSTLAGDQTDGLNSGSGQHLELRVGDDLLVGRELQLESALGQVRTVLLRSVGEVVAPFNQLQWVLGVITALGLLLFALGSGLTARRVAQPLKLLVAATERLGRGRYDEPMQDTGRHDEIGNLARSFDQMRVSIAAQQDEIRRLAYWDRLTGLPNRERFREAVMQGMEQSSGPSRSLAVITLNLDRFKHVNDVLGYALGDRLLQAVAGRLRNLVQAADGLVARLGGDGFAVLLPGVDVAAAQAMAVRIAKVFETPLALDDQTVDISAAIGIACWPEHAADADALLSRAEIAMYAAKSRTLGVQTYDATLDSTSNQTLSLLGELRRAVEQNELRLYLQPKVALGDSSVTAAEALVRWQHPQRGLIPPMDFIPFAEQTGFVRQLTRWMIDEAARLSAQLQADHRPLKLAINLSTRDLLDQEFPNRLAQNLARHGVSAQAFCLEITESAIMDDPQRAEATLNRLSQQGFKLSIDDFGTGYSSLAYLKRLPVDELKIDKSFVIGMAHDDDDAKIVRSTIDLAHNLGLQVVAEGVESEAILQRLRELHCDEAQGYFMSRPLPVAEFMRWRDQWESRA